MATLVTRTRFISRLYVLVYVSVWFEVLSLVFSYCWVLHFHSVGGVNHEGGGSRFLRKILYVSIKVHVVTSQKTVIFRTLRPTL